jgi:hypothetical protein
MSLADVDKIERELLDAIQDGSIVFSPSMIQAMLGSLRTTTDELIAARNSLPAAGYIELAVNGSGFGVVPTPPVAMPCSTIEPAHAEITSMQRPVFNRPLRPFKGSDGYIHCAEHHRLRREMDDHGNRTLILAVGITSRLDFKRHFA